MSFDTERLFDVTATVTLPAIVLGGTYSFTVTVPGAVVGQVAIVNPPVGLLGSLSMWAANVTGANTVTVTIKAGLAISAGAQAFGVGVS